MLSVPEAHILKTALSHLNEGRTTLIPSDNWQTNGEPVIESDYDGIPKCSKWRFKNLGSSADLFLTASCSMAGWDYSVTQYDRETCKLSSIGYAESR